MRLSIACLILLPLCLAACAREAATGPAASANDRGASPQSGANTAIDDATFSFELPGKWEKGTMDGGYEFHRTDEEQVIVTRIPSNGLDDATNVEALSSAQQRAIKALCKSGALLGAPERATEPLLLVRVHATCEKPHVVATFAAVSAHGTVISYEHYRYAVAGMTPELASADAAMFASLRIKAAPAVCPDQILAQADLQKGMCLEAAVLGEGVVADCGGKLRGRGWQRDDLGAKLIAGQTGKKTLVCYHSPAND